MRKCIDFHDGVLVTVYVHVEASNQDVLVEWGEESGVYFSRPRIVCARFVGACEHNSCEFSFELDRSILIEVPEVSVLVIVNSDNRRRYETSTSTHFSMAVNIYMFPENSRIFLVQADRVGNFPHLSV